MRGGWSPGVDWRGLARRMLPFLLQGSPPGRCNPRFHLLHSLPCIACDLQHTLTEWQPLFTAQESHAMLATALQQAMAACNGLVIRPAEAVL